MAIVDFNFEGAAEYKLPEPGQYEMIINKVEYKPPSGDSKGMVVLYCAFRDSEVGSPVRHNLSLSDHPVAKAITRANLAAILRMDLQDMDSYQLDTDDLPGCEFLADIDLEAYVDKNGRPAQAAKIKKMYSLDSNPPSNTSSNFFGGDDEAF